MKHPLIKVIEEYPYRLIIDHAKDVYNWDELNVEEKGKCAIDILKYASDVETTLNN